MNISHLLLNILFRAVYNSIYLLKNINVEIFKKSLPFYHHLTVHKVVDNAQFIIVTGSPNIWRSRDSILIYIIQILR